uniref:Ribosome biogenesis protein NOP53 n=1 Tax=Aplanochytrium stocchinoi TaxID=215587 RepID=A0A7S3PKG7_9STRA
MAPRRKRAKSGTKRKKKPSKYSGKTLDNELREALGGAAAKLQQKTDDVLFFTDTQVNSAPTTRRTLIRRAYLEKKRRREVVGKIIPKTSPQEQKKIDRIKKAAKTETEVDSGTAGDEPLYDIWATESPAKKIKQQADPYCQPALPDEKKIKHQPRSKFDPVQICHPGGSYNPSRKDHSEGLEQLVKSEQKRRAKMHSKVTKLFERFEKEDEEEEEQKNEEDDEDEKGENEEEEQKEGNENKNKVSESKLSRTQRNKKKRLIEAERERDRKQKEKQFKIELHNINELAKKVRQEEAKKEESRKEKAKMLKEKEENAKPVIKVNGKIVPQATPIEVVLPSQLSDNLRRMVPHGGLVSDRFKSMQGRNLVDTGNLNRQRKKPRGRKKAVTQGEPFFKEKLVNTPKGTKSTPKTAKSKNTEN